MSVVLTVFIVPAAYLLVYRQTSLPSISMPRFSIRNPYFIIVICLVLAVSASPAWRGCRWTYSRPSICRKWWSRRSIPACRPRISKPISPIRWSASSPCVSGIDHTESRSLLGVSMIKVFFQPGTNADADVTAALQSGAGRFKAAATRNAAARGVEIRCVQPSRVPGHGQRRRVSTKHNFTIWRSSRSATRSRW